MLSEISRAFEQKMRQRMIHHALHDELMEDLIAAMLPHVTDRDAFLAQCRHESAAASGWEVGRQEDMGRFGLGVQGAGAKWNGQEIVGGSNEPV